MKKTDLSRRKKLPPWMRMQMPGGDRYMYVKEQVNKHNLNTICSSGKCPNIGECWGAGTATFMILGEICTRACKFCAVKTGRPRGVDHNEAHRMVESIKTMGIKHAVITSVDRDDLPDKGAGFWAHTISVLKQGVPGLTMETLIPDFDAIPGLVQLVIDAGPEVISHNLETVERLTPKIRSRAKYRTSLEVIRMIAESELISKSGIMLGLGEKEEEILQTMDDLVDAGCEVLTLGQYLQPTLAHMAVEEYIHPEKFEYYRIEALKRGFSQVESGPLVRSSYHAEKHATSETIVFKDLGLMDYQEAWDYQEERFHKLVEFKRNPEPGMQPDRYLLFCEHPHVYTLGKSGDEANLLIRQDFLRKISATYYKTNRGGDITYHGPGQIVGYPILDLENLNLGLKQYVALLEDSIITLLHSYGITATRMKGATGVWLDVDHPVKARKICAIGVRSSRYVTMHGFALNVNTNLDYFTYINPCGFDTKGVTSMQKELGELMDFERIKEELRQILMQNFLVKKDEYD